MQVLILGAPNSGQSQIAQILKSMNVPNGLDISEINMNVFRTLGADWDRISKFNLSNLSDADQTLFQTQAQTLIQQIPPDVSFSLSDSKLCFLLPLWRQLLTNLLCIFVYRHPIQLAQLFHEEHGHPYAFSLALWERYTRQAMNNMKGLPYIILSYEKLAANPYKTLNKISKQLENLGVSIKTKSLKASFPSIAADLIATEKSDITLLEAELLTQSQARLLKRIKSNKKMKKTDQIDLSDQMMDYLHSFERQMDQQREQDRGKDEELAQLQSRLAEHQQQINKMGEQDRGKDGELAQLQSRLAEHQQQINKLTRQTELQQSHAHILSIWLEKLDHDMTDLLQSVTWRWGRLWVEAACYLSFRKPGLTAKDHIHDLLSGFRDWQQETVLPAHQPDSLPPHDMNGIETRHSTLLRIETMRRTREYFAEIRTKPKAILAITTYNRIDYLKTCVNQWLSTKSDQLDWSLIIADDGSTDGTKEYIHALEIKDIAVDIIENDRVGVHSQQNLITSKIDGSGFDICFMVDDDIIFNEEGWDLAYYYKAKTTSYEHLVYYSVTWKPGIHFITHEHLVSMATHEHVLGCFYTTTQNIIDRVGYIDCIDFGKRGWGHIDYTTRCCRAGFNVLVHPLDLADSEHFISLQPREDYVSSLPKEEEMDGNVGTDLAIKKKVVNSDNRVYVPYNDHLSRPAPRRLSVIIPHAAQSPIRQRNLEVTLKYYHNMAPEAQIIVTEQNTRSDLPDFVEHIPIKNERAFSRSLGFNEGVKRADGDVYLLVDNDCIIDPTLVRGFLSGDRYPYFEAVLPYDFFYDLTEEETLEAFITGIFEGGEKRHWREEPGVGGAMLITKDAYRKIGGFDPQFFGWGGEDDAFYSKCTRLLAMVRADEYHLYHLNHPIDAHILVSEDREKNKQEYQRIRDLTHADLLEYIKGLGTDHFTG